MQIHVTGARGLVGVEVTKALAKLGEVQGTDVQDMDVTDIASVEKVLSAKPPDVIVHLAGLKGNLPSRQEPLKFYDVNTTGTINLMEVGRQLNVKHFVYFSSLTVHGPVEHEVDELGPMNPQHPYSGSKAAAEKMVQAYCNGYGMRATILRPNNIVGPIPQPLPYTDSIIYDFINDIHASGTIELAGDGQFQREWMHPRDVASAVVLAVESTGSGCETYILRGERVTMEELAKRIIAAVGSGKFTSNPQRSGFTIISSGEKIKRQLGWEPKVNLDALIGEIWNEYRSRN